VSWVKKGKSKKIQKKFICHTKPFFEETLFHEFDFLFMSLFFREENSDIFTIVLERGCESEMPFF